MAYRQPSTRRDYGECKGPVRVISDHIVTNRAIPISPPLVLTKPYTCMGSGAGHAMHVYGGLGMGETGSVIRELTIAKPILILSLSLQPQPLPHCSSDRQTEHRESKVTHDQLTHCNLSLVHPTHSSSPHLAPTIHGSPSLSIVTQHSAVYRTLKKLHAIVMYSLGKSDMRQKHAHTNSIEQATGQCYVLAGHKRATTEACAHTFNKLQLIHRT